MPAARPLEDLYIVGPVLIVINALDENEDVGHKRLYAGSNSIPFHAALSQCVSELPPNFRILITSRPEAELEKAFPESPFIHRMYMGDRQLADGVNADILVYVHEVLYNTNITEDDLWRLVKKAEGLFQWAFVACDYIANPPPGLDSEDRPEDILQLSDGNDHLDDLYGTVLRHFNMDNVKVYARLQSVMGQILGAFKPLSLTELNTLCRCAAISIEWCQTRLR